MPALDLGIDPEDLGYDILPLIEKSLGITFSQHDFANGTTYGGLCELVRTKLPTQVVSGCTSQQAFYKLRRALKQQLAEVPIQPNSLLADLLPTKRRAAVARLQAELGMDLDLLTMHEDIAISGALLLLASVACLFFDRPLAFTGITLAISSLWAGGRFGQVWNYKTVREVVEVMSSQHYRQSRRDPGTANTAEMTAILERIFTEYAGLNAAELVPDAIVC